MNRTINKHERKVLFAFCSSVYKDNLSVWDHIIESIVCCRYVCIFNKYFDYLLSTHICFMTFGYVSQWWRNSPFFFCISCVLIFLMWYIAHFAYNIIHSSFVLERFYLHKNIQKRKFHSFHCLLPYLHPLHLRFPPFTLSVVISSWICHSLLIVITGCYLLPKLPTKWMKIKLPHISFVGNIDIVINRTLIASLLNLSQSYQTLARWKEICWMH